MNKLGLKLRALRKQQGMTTIELAAALGYSANSYISEVERGKKAPTMDFVAKVTRLFNVSADWLIDDSQDIELGLTKSTIIMPPTPIEKEE